MVQADSEDSKAQKVHPFFSRTADVSSSTPLAKPSVTLQDHASTPDSEDGSERKKRRTGENIESSATPAPKKQRKPRKSERGGVNGSITSHLAKTEHVDQLPKANDSHTDPIPTPPPSDICNKTNDQNATVTPGSHPEPIPQPEANMTRSSPRNKKVLKFNPKTGTLGSPPKPKRNAPQSKIVSIKYGCTEEDRSRIGSSITQILEAKVDPPKTPTRKRPQRKARNSQEEQPKAEDDLKPTHPFFTGKPKAPAGNESQPAEEPKKSPVKRHTISMATPVSPRKQRDPYASAKMTNFGSMKPVGLKIPGAMHPAWPHQGTSHVRGDDSYSLEAADVDMDSLVSRKFKGQVVSISPEDSLIEHLAHRLSLQSVRDSLPMDDQSLPPPKELRLPRRHFESGRKLQNRVWSQLRTLRKHSQPKQWEMDIDELSEPQPTQGHPAVTQLYKDLERSLSAYDRSTCDNIAWVQKYAPSTASQVLQAGKEATYLKSWLEALRVQAVESGSTDSKSNKNKGRPDKAPKKRRKNKLDDFVVDSDEEDFEMDEISEDEADWAPAGSKVTKRTVVKASRTKDQGRLPNAVVISGPHGSGKTAAVYAVAKELGFEVFEINSGSRRSGKDLLERIGDMTRNHLVHQHHAEAESTEGDDNDETANDIKSGKQGMMTSFFKPKTGQKKPLKEKEKAQETSRPPSKAQKQSLILLEEVDVLYEEDKQFWATLMGLISQSKRPFVMTCNEENLLPLQSLSLYGILRFSPPPAELAADVCLLIAANEGHALQRSAVESLYLSRGNDLRAAITELNYWCQIGIGDRRGGFDWFYLRWPKGSDLDENGDTVRVVSEDTYAKGLGWLGRDLMATSPDALDREDEAMHQCWDYWQLSVGDWHQSLDMQSCTNDISQPTPPGSRIEALAAYEQFTEALSDSELCSNGAFGAGLDDVLDPGLPDLTAKTKEDFILGRQLLEAEPLTPQVCLDTSISTSLSCLARQCLLDCATCQQCSNAASILSPLDEDKAISVLESSFRKDIYYLTRLDLAFAFDPIAVAESAVPTSYLDPSVFDRTFKLIVTDVAPWVRSIVSYDHQLMVERKKMSSLLSEGGQKKRMRNTRSAYSALEGGERRNTRREKYFQGCINTTLVLNTGVKAWQDAAKEVVEEAEEPALRSPRSSMGSPASE